MCFSATASFIAGVTTTGIGIKTIKNTKSKRELPLASIPILFGLQQFIEGAIWMSLGSQLLNTIFTYIFIFYSHIWWPFFVPFAIFLIEDDKIRKKFLFLIMIIGIAVGLNFMIFTITGPVVSSIINSSIAYSCIYYNVEIVFFCYMLSTTLCCFISSHRVIQFFGVAIFVSAVITYYYYFQTFTSVWCFFSAILSLVLYMHFKKEYKILDYINSMVEKMKNSFDTLR